MISFSKQQRQQYVSLLMQQMRMMKLLMQPKQKLEKSKIVVFDWDDTLFATTAIMKQSQREISENVHNCNAAELTTQSELILRLLNTYSLIFGEENIFIVTNGEQHWVLKSLTLLIGFCRKNGINNSFHSIFKYLLNSRITMISASHSHSKQYPKQTMLWKYLIFKQIIASRKAKCFISIGDSFDEFHASQKLIGSNNKHITLHRLKLKQRPSIVQMNQQSTLMISLATAFDTQAKNITIDYEKEFKSSCSDVT